MFNWKKCLRAPRRQGKLNHAQVEMLCLSYLAHVAWLILKTDQYESLGAVSRVNANDCKVQIKSNYRAFL